MIDPRVAITTEISPDETLVYLVRHGVTEWNLHRRVQGQLNVPLSEEGIEQARLVANWLANQQVKFAALCSSDLLRAAQTAGEIGKRLFIAPRFTPALREIHGGDWQGLDVTEIEARYPGMLREWRENVSGFRLPGMNGESIPDVQRRVYPFYREIVERHRGEAVILVSHGAALSALQAAIHGWDLQDTWHTGRARLGNTGVTVLSVEHAHGKCDILLANYSEHLPRPTGLSSVIDPGPAF
jgi:phosphoserine phosphatase